MDERQAFSEEMSKKAKNALEKRKQMLSACNASSDINKKRNRPLTSNDQININAQTESSELLIARDDFEMKTYDDFVTYDDFDFETDALVTSSSSSNNNRNLVSSSRSSGCIDRGDIETQKMDDQSEYHEDLLESILLNHINDQVRDERAEEEEEEEEEEVNSDNSKQEITFKEKIEILPFIDEILNAIIIYKKPRDFDTPLFKDSMNSLHSKGDFANGIESILVNHKCTKLMENDLLKFLYNKLNSHCNIPIKISSNLNCSSDINKYSKKVQRILEFDSCPMGCCIFVGKYAQNIHCPNPKCSADRYRSLGGTSIKKVYYRPIKPLIYQLMHTTGFLLALNYDYIKTSENEFRDIMCGTEPQKQLMEMSEQFKKKKLSNKVIPVNLIFGLFYDGVQVFKHKVTSFWPLSIMILNLPPTYRTKLGVGIFLLSLITLKNGNFMIHFVNCV
jgi:hypothetical protein